MSKRRSRVPIRLIQWDKTNPYNAVPIVEVKIDMTTCLLLIDTGASVSFLDAKFVETRPELKIFIEKGDIIEVDSFEKSNKKVSKVIHTKNLTIRNATFEHILYVMPLNISFKNKELNYHGILGSDFLLEHKAIINLENLTMTI